MPQAQNCDQMDDCEVLVPSTLLDWNTMAAFFPWGLLLIRYIVMAKGFVKNDNSKSYKYERERQLGIRHRYISSLTGAVVSHLQKLLIDQAFPF